jgi:hypothetical protein
VSDETTKERGPAENSCAGALDALSAPAAIEVMMAEAKAANHPALRYAVGVDVARPGTKDKVVVIPAPAAASEADLFEAFAREATHASYVGDLAREWFGPLVVELELVASEPCVLHWSPLPAVVAMENRPGCNCYPCRARAALSALRARAGGGA